MRALSMVSKIMAALSAFYIALSTNSAKAADGMATKAISAGVYNSMALRSDGTVWTWGWNLTGECGNSVKASPSAFITNAALLSSTWSNFVAVSAGGDIGTFPNNLVGFVAHTLVLQNNGCIMACGHNTYGELGNGTYANSTNLVSVASLTNVVAISAGGDHSLALKSDGTVWGWGRNEWGQLGSNPSLITKTNQPVAVAGLTNIVAIATGLAFSLALKGDGTVWAWGWAEIGQLGNGTSAAYSWHPSQVIVSNASPNVLFLTNIISIAANDQNAMALKSDGTVWCWGFNGAGNVGIGSLKPSPIRTATRSLTTENVVAIAAGGDHCLALTSSGGVLGWGWNGYSEILSPVTYPDGVEVPTLIPDCTNVVSISAGAYHSLALLANGTMLAWGYDAGYQLGINGIKFTYPNPPGPVSGVSQVGLELKNHSLLTTEDGTVWSFGCNTYGELGDGSVIGRSYPVEVENQYETVAVSPGRGHSLAVKLDGSAWAWGDNSFGQIGDGTTINRIFAVPVTNLSGATAVAAGGQHSLALETNGVLYSWGANTYGQIGDGTTTNRPAPVAIAPGTNVIAIAAGGEHSLAVLSNTTVWAWGGNTSGQIGDGTTTNRPNLTYVGLTNAIAVSAGGDHSLALLSNGTVWAWGNNLCGQVGDGTLTNRPVPVSLTNLPSVAAIAAGGRFSAALTTVGTVWVWGYNAYGLLGGAPTNLPVPVPIPGLSSVVAIQAEENNLVVTMADGSVWTSGQNLFSPLTQSPIASQTAASPIMNFNLVRPTFNNSNPNSLATNAPRYVRGYATNLTSISIVSPLDSEIGIALNPTNNNTNNCGGAWPWFSSIQLDTRYQINQTYPSSNLYTYPFAFVNPIVDFGAMYGGTPLYVGQSYSFGILPGQRIECSNNVVPYPEFSNAVRILVYARSNFISGSTNIAAISTNDVYIPREFNHDPGWSQFASNGYTTTLRVPGLTTVVQLYETQLTVNGTNVAYTNYVTNSNVFPIHPFGSVAGQDTYVVTHTASGTATNYYYRIEALGALAMTTNWAYFVTNASGAYSRSILYTLDFSAHPPWRSQFVDQPQYEGQPQPSIYEGTLTSTSTTNLTVLNYPVSLSNACTNINTSPELWRSPVLDQFVSDMGNDPIALARYVFNEIALSDYVAYGPSNTSYASINLGGINRTAQATFLEGEGSPAEQCALLVYLLRQAGFKAAYMFPTNNNVLMLNSNLDNLLRVKVSGASVDGMPYTTNSYVVVNYPWVVANINTNTVHIFPWLKDTKVTEGLDLYDYLPTNYNSGIQWVRAYLNCDPNIITSIYSSNSPAILFPAFIQNSLLANYPGISLNDIGVQIANRPHFYARWQDFPTPDIVTNLTNTALVQDFGTITNNLPGKTNYFDTIQLSVVGVHNKTNNSLLSIGPMRMSDLQNRRLIWAQTLAGTKSNYIWLEPFSTNITGVTNFGSAMTGVNTNCLMAQSNTFIATGYSNLNVSLAYYRHQFEVGMHDPNFNTELGSYLGVNEQFTNTSTRPIVAGDVAGLCISLGHVTQNMLNVHAVAFAQIEAQKAAHKSYVPAVVDYKGASAYLMGMTYFKRLSQWQDQCKSLHKMPGDLISGVTFGPARFSSANSKIQPIVDMQGNDMVNVDPDYDLVPLFAMWNYWWLSIAGGSAEEHQTIDAFFNKTNAISTVALLQIAKQNATAAKSGIIEMNPFDVGAIGSVAPAGYGTALAACDTNIWNQMTNLLSIAAFPEMSYAFMTPAPMSNSDGSYQGMGALVYTGGDWAALIGYPGSTLNGGFGALQDDFSDDPSDNDFDYLMLSAPDGSPYLQYNGNTSTGNQLMPQIIPTSELADDWSPDECNPDQAAEAGEIDQVLQYDGSSVNDSLSHAADVGHFGISSFFATIGKYVLDPVDPITGEFYINEVDLTLPGPLSLEIRRTYASQNTSQNQFGYGWMLGYMPYLVLTTNKTSTLITIYGAETDGSVIAYRQTGTNLPLFKPLVADNPQLNNYTHNGIGSTANLFNAAITNFSVGTNQYYRLLGADGSVRTFLVTSFPVTGATKTVYRQRPYLQQWLDAQGNYCTFSYGTDSSQPDYGQVRRIQSSNGNFVGFYYDEYGHIIQAYSSDGRMLYYDYDDNGDLTTVTRPDGSQVQYSYQQVQTTTNVYSTHLIVLEVKPDGHSLGNVYDSTNRVVAQMATVGQDLNLYTNGLFNYSNNYTVNATNGISGHTFITDIRGNVTRYDYTNSMITTNTDPLGQQIVQQWYWTNSSAGGYQRSLMSARDKRGLTSTYLYDTNGNALTNILSGADLTGDGQTSATNTFGYNTRNLLIGTTNPIGNWTILTYTNANFPYLPTSLGSCAANGTLMNSNQLFYTNISNVVVQGDVTLTNQAFGLRWRAIKAAGLSDATTNDCFYGANGFLSETIAYTGTSDPNITNYYVYDNGGQLIQISDADGRSTTFMYDGMGRLASKEVFDTAGQIPVYSESRYYDGNGNLTWLDGPRSNPNGYIWADYDGANRKIQEIHWRSQAQPNGFGVEAATGDNLYGTTFSQYDGFGNLLPVSDQLGDWMGMIYDVDGQLIDRRTFAPNNPNPLTIEKFAYEPGGNVSLYTNVLGGVTSNYYTTTGKLSQKVNPDGSINRWTFYLDGRTNKVYLANSNYWQLTYNDGNRLITRTNSGDSSFLETRAYDHRGNLILTTNAELGVYTNIFTNTFDGLDRIKIGGGPGNNGTGSSQQLTIYTYDGNGHQLVTSNALGESVTLLSDALGRVTNNAVTDSGGTTVRVSSKFYSADFNSVTTVSGTGGGAVTNTIYSDTYGKTVLAQEFPAGGAPNFKINSYDILERLASSQDELGRVTSYSYDALSRVTNTTLPDATVIGFGYDAAGNMVNRAMPGNLVWSATYDSASRMTAEQLKGSTGSVERSCVYQYYGSGAVGMVSNVVDLGRSVTNTVQYDAYLRVSANLVTAASTNQGLTNTYQYDDRGLATNVVQTGSGYSSQILRSFDGYGQLASEESLINGTEQSYFVQNWNGAGRRVSLNQASSLFGGTNLMSYRADGSMTNIAQGGFNCGFGYDEGGFLTSRSDPWRTVAIVRDGQGRIISETNTVSTSVFGEAITWGPNSQMSSYIASRSGAGAWTNNQSYAYDIRNRLTNEPVGISNGVAATAYTHTFDGSGLGVRIGAHLSGGLTNEWTGATDSFGQIATEAWNQSGLTLQASGMALSASSVALTLDGSSLGSVTPVDNRWTAALSLSAGTSHTLSATAIYNNGLPSAAASSSFAVSGTNDVTNYFDGAGYVTNRVFYSSNKVQNLTWDGLGRLVTVVERDYVTNGFNWSAIYDASGRRLRTVTIPVTNSVPNVASTLTVDSYYDPQVKYAEVAVSVNGVRTWKVLGPDINGRYGGMHGVGGLEATVQEADGAMVPVLNDYFGNVLATIASGSVTWSPIRVGAYGPVMGYRPATVAPGAVLAETLVWRSRSMDPSGLYCLGARYYDPMGGHFLSPDPLGHAACMDLYSFCNGDPCNCFDPDGKLAKTAGAALFAGVAGTIQTAEEIAISPLVFLGNSAFAGSFSAGFEAALTGIVQRGFDTYGIAYDQYQHAGFLGDLGLWGVQLPFIGRFIPGPTGSLDGAFRGVGYSQGINQVDIVSTAAEDMYLGKRLGANNVLSAPYVGGSIFEVITELFLGNNGPGMEYASQIENDLGNTTGGWINQVDHSGGDIRSLIGSTYLGAYNIGVNINLASQGPIVGYYNNVGTIDQFLSPGFKEPTSTVSWLLQSLALGVDTESIWNAGTHIAPGNSSYWDTTISGILNQYTPH